MLGSCRSGDSVSLFLGVLGSLSLAEGKSERLWGLRVGSRIGACTFDRFDFATLSCCKLLSSLFERGGGGRGG